jgi:WD40 repeat protein
MANSTKTRDLTISTHSLYVYTNLFQSGFHSKQISCIQQVPLFRADASSSYRLLISASEDTTVRLSVVSHSDALRTIAVLQSHISSVRALAVCQLDDSALVFSGGGRAQLKVWKLVIQEAQG